MVVVVDMGVNMLVEGEIYLHLSNSNLAPDRHRDMLIILRYGRASIGWDLQSKQL